MKKRINITIEENILDKVDQMAKERGVDRSTMITVLIYDASQIIELRDKGVLFDGVSHWSIEGLGKI